MAAAGVAWIVDGIRTPIGRYGGALVTVRPDNLARVGAAGRRGARKSKALERKGNHEYGYFHHPSQLFGGALGRP